MAHPCGHTPVMFAVQDVNSQRKWSMHGTPARKRYDGSQIRLAGKIIYTFQEYNQIYLMIYYIIKLPLHFSDPNS